MYKHEMQNIYNTLMLLYWLTYHATNILHAKTRIYDMLGGGRLLNGGCTAGIRRNSQVYEWFFFPNKNEKPCTTNPRNLLLAAGASLLLLLSVSWWTNPQYNKSRKCWIQNEKSSIDAGCILRDYHEKYVTVSTTIFVYDTWMSVQLFVHYNCIPTGGTQSLCITDHIILKRWLLALLLYVFSIIVCY